MDFNAYINNSLTESRKPAPYTRSDIRSELSLHNVISQRPRFRPVKGIYKTILGEVFENSADIDDTVIVSMDETTITFKNAPIIQNSVRTRSFYPHTGKESVQEEVFNRIRGYLRTNPEFGKVFTISINLRDIRLIDVREGEFGTLHEYYISGKIEML